MREIDDRLSRGGAAVRRMAQEVPIGTPDRISHRQVGGSRRRVGVIVTASLAMFVAITATVVYLDPNQAGDAGTSAPTGSDLPYLGLNLAGWYEQVEQFKQDCMVEQGFQYFPDLPRLTTDDPRSSGLLLDVAPSDEQWAASDSELLTFGYGYFINREEVVAGGSGPTDADPTAAYLASLSDSDRAAYSQALAGCSRAAEDRIPSPPVIDGLGDLELEIDARINQDSRLIAARQQWTDCVAVAGFLIPEGDVFLYLAQRFELVTGLDRSGADLSALPPGMLEQLQQEELALAAADVTCQQPLREVYREVAADVTAQVLGENPQIAEQLADFGE